VTTTPEHTRTPGAHPAVAQPPPSPADRGGSLDRVVFGVSAVSGIAKGIQWLANTNMVLAVVLAVFVFVVGPTVLILNMLPTTIGTYVAELGRMAARTEASGGDATAAWLRGWTVFYWAWWISWTPFVGLFIARISRGRTIRPFVTGVLLVPSVVSLVWCAVFGGTGIAAQRSGVDVAGQATAEAQLFGVLDTHPLATVMTVLVMALVAIFFVSGADAASIVMGSLSERGTLSPSRTTVVFWAWSWVPWPRSCCSSAATRRSPDCRT
jgi:choline-glycine betaine transporter